MSYRRRRKTPCEQVLVRYAVDVVHVQRTGPCRNCQPAKCCHICISLLAKKTPVDCRIDDVVLNAVDKVRDLGIFIDSKLTFVEYINLMVAKAHRRANQILRCFLSKDNEILVKASITYVRPILECSSPVWSLTAYYWHDEFHRIHSASFYQEITWLVISNIR